MNKNAPSLPALSIYYLHFFSMHPNVLQIVSIFWWCIGCEISDNRGCGWKCNYSNFTTEIVVTFTIVKISMISNSHGGCGFVRKKICGCHTVAVIRSFTSTFSAYFWKYFWPYFFACFSSVLHEISVRRKLRWHRLMNCINFASRTGGD